MTRHSEIKDFLKTTEWAKATVSHLAGDASARKYLRAELNGQTAVIMDAPPELGNDDAPFLSIASHLRANGLNAPEILKVDPVAGLILMEDFGDQLFFNLVNEQPRTETKLYHAALDVLDHLHSAPLPAEHSHYGAKEMSEAAGLAPIWYAPGADPNPMVHATSAALEKLDWSAPALVLRDFHAQNLVWCNKRTGLMKVGLLDFQDAQVGHHLYDAVSLIFDARRDVSSALIDELTERLRAASPDPADFDLAFATLSAQRNLRILGVFARLCARDGKPGYVDLIPRVWRNLQRDLQHPELTQLRDLTNGMPEPGESHLNRLRDLCHKPQQM